MRQHIKNTLFLLVCVLLPCSTKADYQDDIGYTALQVELGLLSIAMPTGAGVTVSQVEADGDGVVGAPYAYMPNTAASQFSADTITNISNVSTTVSSHATMVGGLIYGSNAIASGINQVGIYEVNNWLAGGFLRPGQTTAPSTENRDIQNHSWVGTSGSTSTDTLWLNRLDYAIQRDDFVAVVGVNNGVGQERNLLSSAYNVISVGVTSGNHSYGDTTINIAGRTVPHLVVPTGTTSEATAVVSAASALLIEQARGMSSANGEKSETVKAVLLAGATKGEFATWSSSSTQPLDAVYGAGELNVQNNYHIMAAGEQSPSGSSDVASTGWDFDTVDTSSSKVYYFELLEESSLSIALTWNAQMIPDDPPGPNNTNYDSMTLHLPDLKLELYEASAFTLGSMLSQSNSPVDNVEHLWDSSLSTGRYAIVVSRSSDSYSIWDYAVAWQAIAIPEPSTWALLLTGSLTMMMVLNKRRRSL